MRECGTRSAEEATQAGMAEAIIALRGALAPPLFGLHQLLEQDAVGLWLYVASLDVMVCLRVRSRHEFQLTFPLKDPLVGPKGFLSTWCEVSSRELLAEGRDRRMPIALDSLQSRSSLLNLT